MENKGLDWEAVSSYEPAPLLGVEGRQKDRRQGVRLLYSEAKQGKPLGM